MMNNVVLNTFHLFAGAGGGILADSLLGFRTIGAVEIDDYARRVLLHRQLDGQLNRFPIWDDVVSFRYDNSAVEDYVYRLCFKRRRLCICGGFPCQDISTAGKRVGIEGKRSGLWKEFARIIGEIQPAYVFVENSPELVRRGLDRVVGDFTERGYSFAWRIVSAADVGAPHLRKRFWGLAVSNSLLNGEGRIPSDKEMENDKLRRNLPNSDSQHSEECSVGISTQETFIRPDELCKFVSYALHDRNGGWLRELQKDSQYSAFINGRETLNEGGERRETKSRLGGMANEFPDWLDATLNGEWFRTDEFGIPRLRKVKDKMKRLKAIGNAQVPLCAAIAFELLLKDICKWIKNDN